MLAGAVPAVVEVPQLGTLIARIPLAELVTQGEDALLGAGLLLVAATASEDCVELVVDDRVEKGLGLQGVAGAVGALAQTAVVDVVLDARDLEAEPEAFDRRIAVFEDLGEVVTRVDVQDRERHGCGPERLGRQVQHHDRVLAAGEQQNGTFEFGHHLTENMDGFGLEPLELAQASFVSQCHACHFGRPYQVWRPHSVLSSPAQRPARGSSPGATRRVQGSQPIDG